MVVNIHENIGLYGTWIYMEEREIPYNPCFSQADSNLVLFPDYTLKSMREWQN